MYKHHMKRFAGALIAFLTLILCIFAAAEVYSGDCGTNVSWQLDTGTGLLTISGSGAMPEFYYYEHEDKYDDPTHYTYPWYNYRSSVTKAVVSSGITSIGQNTFATCYNLREVQLPSTLTDIGRSAFESTPLTGITIPASVKTIGAEAFYKTQISSIELPQGLLSLGSYAFANTPLSQLPSLPPAIKTISSGLFASCSLITQVSIPSQVTSIEDSAFANSGLTEIVLPQGLRSLGKNAFSNTQLSALPSLPQGITTISSGLFASCSLITQVSIPSQVTAIEDSAFAYSGLSEIILPQGLRSIGSSAFANTGLTEVVFHDGIQTIGAGAFSGTAIQAVTIPASVTDLASSAFPESTVISFSSGTEGRYSGFTGDLQWYIFDNVLHIKGQGDMPDYASYDAPWNSYASYFSSVTIYRGVTSVGNYAFYDYSVRSISLPNTISRLGTYSLNTTFLSSLTVPDSVIEIGLKAINNATQVTGKRAMGSTGSLSWVIKNDVLQITGSGDMPDYTYQDNSSMIGLGYYYSENADMPWYDYRSHITSISIGDGATSIGRNAFTRCSSATAVTIPNTVKRIGTDAFDRCDAITSIHFGTYADAALWPLITFENAKANPMHNGNTTLYLGNNMFYGINSLHGSISAFAFYNYQKNFEINANGGVNYRIGHSAFYNCQNMTSISIPTSMRYVGNYAFYNCKSLNYLFRLDDGLTYIGDYAFYGCSSLTSIDLCWSGIPQMEYLGAHAFELCTGLKTLKLGVIQNIPESLVARCSSLQSVVIQEGTESIGSLAFNYAGSLGELALPNTVNSVSNTAFEGCSSLMKIQVQHCDSLTYRALIAAGYTDIIKVEEHTWGEPVYTWAEDYTTLTASRSCGICDETEETETVQVSVEEVLTSSSCTEPGEGVYTSAAFENEAFSAQTVTASLPLAEHTPVTIEGYPATCTEEGLMDEIFCGECGASIQDPDPIPALGHDWQWTTSAWAEDGSSCHMSLTCARCGETAEAEANVSAEAEENTSCTEWAWTTYTASLSYDGLAFTDTMQLQNVEPVPHTPEILPLVAPTCTETGLTEGRRCSVCGEILEAQEIVPTLGHDWQLGSASWAEDGSACTFAILCSRCEESQTREADVTADAEVNTSCTELAWTTYTASVTIDGQTLTDTKRIQDVAPAPHQIEIVTAVAPTDREPGCTEEHFCSVCGTVLQAAEEIPALWSYSDDGLTVTAYNGTETDLTIPEGVTTLSKELFKSNTSITSIRIPEGVTSLGTQSFFQAVNLREVWLPDSLQGNTITAQTFYNVSAVFHANAGSPAAKVLSYRNFDFVDQNGWAMRYAIRTVTSEPTAVSIAGIPDEGETSLTIPADIGGIPVTELKSLAAANHAALIDVHLPDTLVTIASDAFEGCPEGLTIYSSATAPARTWAQENGYVWAHEAHQPEILAAVAATCTEDGLAEGSWCLECGEILTVQEVIPALGHDWSTVTYTWAEDNSTVTASHVCAHNAEHTETETVPASAAVTKQPTCEENGETTYTSGAFENPAFSVQTKVVANITSLGHDWSDITYTWAEDYSTVTASRICAHNPDHTETETAIVTQYIVSPTETSEGSCEWISNPYENEAFVQQTKSVTIPALNTLSVLRIPAGVQTIEEEAFEGVPAQAILIPDGCTVISRKAFAGCTNLLYVRIPASVTSIAADAFDDCPTVIIDRIN